MLMMKYELKKIITKRLNRLMLATLFLIAVACSCFAAGSVRYRDSDGSLHTGITAARRLADDRNKWKGELTIEKISEIVKSRKELEKKYPQGIPDTEYGKTIQSYEDITGLVVSILVPSSDWDESVLFSLTDEEIANLDISYSDHMQKMIQEYGKTKKQQELIKKQYEKIKIPMIYAAKDSWDTMAMYAQTYGIILAIVIGFLVSGIFAEEFQTGTEAVFLASKYGRSKATRNKIVTGIYITTLVYWSGMGILSLLSFGIMGISGYFTPYQIDQPYSIYIMTYGQYYLLILLCGYIASLFAASITMLVTVKMHTANVAVCIPFFLYCMLPFIGRVLSSYTSFFNFMPNVLMNIIESAKDAIFFQIGNLAVRQISLVMLLYSVMSVMMLPFVYRGYRRYT